ncbi:hypothetical protein DCAR_0519330 [Daucus carota subsp. sativus]|uniref:VQ domain-containing protein n=1 Tax=Daucus carota subsp. sativus TaxID=79200 RepID=A0AAF1AZ11_DAUCS|nr:hypothetical protein DCAR_0519330 [Daucus carota subsp. sativus]
MGKKMSKKNVKKCKRESNSTSTSDATQNFNHLVKVLKPRVYITHPSNFKSLVHQLTAGGIPIPSPTPVSSQSSMPSIVLQPTDDQQIQLMPDKVLADQDFHCGVLESSPEWAFERSCSEIIDVPFTPFGAWTVSEDLSLSAQILSDDMMEQFHSSLFGDEVESSWISEMNNPSQVCEFAYI